MLNKGLVLFVILAVLLLPNKSFEVYYSIIGFQFIFFSPRELKVNRLHIFLFVYFSFLLFFRSIFWLTIVELKEWIKLVFMLIGFLFLKRNWFFIYDKLFMVIFFYTVLNFLVTLSLVFGLFAPLNSFIFNFYTADSQRILYTYDSIRSTGLSSGVGQQGIISLISFVYFGEIAKKRRLKYIAMMIAFLTLFFSQSKTAIVFGSIYIILTYRKNLAVLATLLLTAFYLIYRYYDFLKILFREIYLFLTGVGFSSFKGRISNWETFLLPMVDNPISFVFGIGRGYFEVKGQDSSVFDSDIVYVFVNFGLIGFILFIMLMVNSLKSLKIGQKFAMIIIALNGLTLNPIFDPKLFIF